MTEENTTEENNSKPERNLRVLAPVENSAFIAIPEDNPFAGEIKFEKT
jgi:hypothetical protein